MRNFKDLEQVNWGEIESHAGTSEHFPELLRQYVESPDRHERLEASSELWTDSMRDGVLSPVAPRLIEFMVPLLNDDQRDDRPIILMNLAEACRCALEPNQDYVTVGYAAIAAESLQMIEEGFPAYFCLWTSEDLRNVVTLILTAYPHRVADYLPRLMRHYHSTKDYFEKAELLVAFDRIADHVEDFDNLLLLAATNPINITLRYLAACLYVIRYGSASSRDLLDILETTTPEVPMPLGGWRLMHLPTAPCLRRALRSLPRSQHMRMLVSILDKVSTTIWAHYLVTDLVEAANGQADILLRRSYQEYAFRHEGSASRAIRVDLGEPDWIPAVVNCTPFWINDCFGSAIETNLFSLFGLPAKRQGLIELWEALYKRPFPIRGE